MLNVLTHAKQSYDILLYGAINSQWLDVNK